MTQTIIVCFMFHESKNGSLWCKWRQDKIVLEIWSVIFPKDIWHECRQRKYVKEFLPKCCKKGKVQYFLFHECKVFLLRKSTFLRILCWKERKVGSIVGKRWQVNFRWISSCIFKQFFKINVWSWFVYCVWY